MRKINNAPIPIAAVRFPFLLNKYNLDLVHFMHFNVPWLYRRKFITTIHDLIITHFPTSRASQLNPIMYKFKLFFYNRIISQAARRAERIITVSNFSKEDIPEAFKENRDIQKQRPIFYVISVQSDFFFKRQIRPGNLGDLRHAEYSGLYGKHPAITVAIAPDFV